MLNGKVSSFDALVESLSALRESSGTIWYYGEPCRKAPPIATQVLIVITACALRVEFAGKSDFSGRV
jgi:hypothetical protein